jgi:hypothetical protein
MRKAGLNLAMLPVRIANCEKNREKIERNILARKETFLFSFDIIYTLYV